MGINEELFVKQAQEEIEIIKDGIEIFLNTFFRKYYVLDYRVKSLDKLRLKQQRNGYESIDQAPDILGIRISVRSEEEVREISHLIERYLSPTRLVDYFNQPKSTGFKAFLYYFNTAINSEIQVMTIDMRDWTNRTHDEHNLRKYGNTVDTEKKLTQS